MKTPVRMMALSFVFLTQIAVAEYEPREGHWRVQLVLVSDEGVESQVILSSAKYPDACVKSMGEISKKVENANGYVWTNPELQSLAFSRTNSNNVRHEVSQFQCFFKAWQ